MAYSQTRFRLVYIVCNHDEDLFTALKLLKNIVLVKEIPFLILSKRFHIAAVFFKDLALALQKYDEKYDDYNDMMLLILNAI